jgi:hypothetical protein
MLVKIGIRKNKLKKFDEPKNLVEDSFYTRRYTIPARYDIPLKRSWMFKNN